VPVWHKGTEKWVKDGKLVLLGVIQEQHPDRCRLFAQWKGLGWPILLDPINVMGVDGVPILTAIDEHGIVRDTKPRLEGLKKDFLDKRFADDSKGNLPRRQTPELGKDQTVPDFEALRRRAEEEDRASAWRDLGDALALWGGEKRVNDAIDAYGRAVKMDPKDGPAHFRLGVCFRRRYESEQRQAGDFQEAIDHWSQALDVDPNIYIWRRRIQQYGPRLDKPYSFYDWVEEAEKDISARGDKPTPLQVRPGGAELARPLKTFKDDSKTRSPDPDGKVQRDDKGAIRAEATVVPSRVRSGQAVRIHVVLRPDGKQKTHWNNEADPLRLWITPPEGWQVAARLLESAGGKLPQTDEERALDFEIKVPEGAKGKVRLGAYALYHICDDAGGQCRFLRLDIPIEVRVGE
jgi:tetratricopeptide (TPR) repeat protein